ncbi:MAG: ABC transporter substrate-binding protein [Euryarchaeota archaeon]|nr:ABC transporter substrate-binding protein [Euryarchaeota archaeon]
MDSNKRRIVAIALVAVLVVAATAVVVVSGMLKQEQFSSSVTDAAGKYVALDKRPERIVSCSPAISEIVCALGLGDKLVAVTDYDDYPAEAAKLVEDKHTIGGYYTPSFEKILEYEPDLVLVNSRTGPHQELAERLYDAKYTVVQLYPQENLEEVYKSIELVGKIAGKTDKADELISSMKASISDVGSKVKDLEKPNVMYVTYAEAGFTSVYLTGSGTAVDEIIALSGGKNAFVDLEGWVAPSDEEFKIRAKSIDCMVITSMYSGSDVDDMNAYFQDDDLWKESPAVKNNTIFYLQGQGENIFNRQSVRMVDAVQMMAQMLHPDAFETKVPYDETGATPNVIGDNYLDYLTLEASPRSSSGTVMVAACLRG